MQKKLIIHIIISHLAFMALCFVLYEESKVAFLVSEFMLYISLWVSVISANKLTRPLKLLSQGINSIKEKDFNVKLKELGKTELGKLVEVYNEMIENLRLERTKIQEQNFFLDKLVNSSPNGIIIYGFDGKIESINPFAKKLIFKEDKIIESWSEKIDEIKFNNSSFYKDENQKKYKIQKSYFLDKGVKRKFVIIEELTSELDKTEKETYGKVIRMMAHEVNNSIGAVNSIVDSSIYHLKKNPQQNRDYIEALQIAYERNASMNRFMKNFADVVRLAEPQKTEVNINDVLMKTSLLSKSMVGNKNVEFVNKLSNKPFVLLVDQEQLEQVFINIFKNALEAIHLEGKIEYETNISKHSITISNNGEMINEVEKEKLFETFYSSKKSGQGIGLTLTKEILNNHGFKYGLKTGEDGWTRFAIEV
jgi:nitrogen fixation/metabolism regulation signal transduction histidine kinase